MFPGCPSCSSASDGYDGFADRRARAHGLERSGVSSQGSDLNFDYGVAYTPEELAERRSHNMHRVWEHDDTPDEPFRGPRRWRRWTCRP
jgi:predicted dithiol-disulfide oxidoreductase (DUF899 family)